MLDSDTVAKFRRNTATRIEWSLRANLPVQRLLDAMRETNGRTKLRNVPAANRTSPLSKPRVLREAASELAELENAACATYLELLEKLKGRRETTTVGRMFPSPRLPDDWRNVPKSDVQPALAAFRDGCASLSLPAHARESAGTILTFLRSATGRQLSDLGHLQDIDLADWQTDHGVLRNVLRKLGNPAEWIQTWLDAGTPSNVVSRRDYTNAYSVLALNAVVAARKFRKNLWASRRQWERMGCSIVDGERGAPVFHYFSPREGDDERDAVGGADRSGQGPLRRVSFVFKVSQVSRADGRPFRLPNLVQKRGDVDECISRHDARIVHREVDSPFYDSGADAITMPPRAGSEAGQGASRLRLTTTPHCFTNSCIGRGTRAGLRVARSRAPVDRAASDSEAPRPPADLGAQVAPSR